MNDFSSTDAARLFQIQSDILASLNESKEASVEFYTHTNETLQEYTTSINSTLSDMLDVCIFIGYFTFVLFLFEVFRLIKGYFKSGR